MKVITLIVSMVFLFSACSTLQVDTDFDSKYNFKDKTKYTIVHNAKEGDNTLINDRIKESLRESLNAKKYEEVSKEEADLVFVFHVNVTNRSDIRTDYQRVGYSGYGYGYNGYGGYGTHVIAVPTTYQWREGRLVVDALNPKTKKIVWRGIVSDELTRSSLTSKEKTDYIDKVISKLMQKFPR